VALPLPPRVPSPSPRPAIRCAGRSCPALQPIASDLEPEANATLRIYNYPDYLDKAVIQDFEKEYAQYQVKVEYSTFNDYPEALTKIRSGSVPYDLSFLSYNYIGRLVYGQLIQPLNHDYLGNIANVWQEFQNPWYDLDWQSTVPTSSTPPASAGART
jgi:spermidine/putrescine transport system substrate-binding protein